MDVDSRHKEKQEIVKRYYEAERKLMLADEEILRLQKEIEALKLQLAEKK